MATYSDPFTGTGAVASIWTVSVGTPSLMSDQLGGGSVDYNNMWFNSTPIEPDQFSRLRVGTYGGTGYGVLTVRSSGTGSSRTEYVYNFSGAVVNADLFRVVNNTSTKIVDLAETYGVPSHFEWVTIR
jgi:hypothetical protein